MKSKKQKPQLPLTKEQIEELQKQIEEDQKKETKDNPLYTDKFFDETMRQLTKEKPPEKK